MLALAWGHFTPDRQTPEGSVNSSAASFPGLSVGAGSEPPKPSPLTYLHQLDLQPPGTPSAEGLSIQFHELVGDISHSNQSGTLCVCGGGSLEVRSGLMQHPQSQRTK